MPSPPMAAEAAGVPAGPLAAVDAVVFDTDGVLLDSAGLHAAAWKTAFDPVLEEAGQAPFDAAEEYRVQVDGKSRMDGVAALLRARGLPLPAGTEQDPPGTGSLHAVAAAKERAFTGRLREAAVPALPGSRRLLEFLGGLRIPCAAVSASRHAGELLARAGLRQYFAVLVDGGEARRLRLPGKPDPALFLEAARRLGVDTRRSAVLEDALAGVAAGRAGGFRTVVGVNRAGTAESADRLRAYGADLVVGDPGELLPAGVAPVGETATAGETGTTGETAPAGETTSAEETRR